MSFNTQPPEGGWLPAFVMLRTSCGFQHTAARRRLVYWFRFNPDGIHVSTHSRPKAAGLPSHARRCRSVFQHTAARRRLACHRLGQRLQTLVSTHSRPKAAGQRGAIMRPFKHRFNTQPPEGGWRAERSTVSFFRGFNTQPPEGGWLSFFNYLLTFNWFQHTAARRRLAMPASIFPSVRTVSTHSRPKAAGAKRQKQRG